MLFASSHSSPEVTTPLRTGHCAVRVTAVAVNQPPSSHCSKPVRTKCRRRRLACRHSCSRPHWCYYRRHTLTGADNTITARGRRAIRVAAVAIDNIPSSHCSVTPATPSPQLLSPTTSTGVVLPIFHPPAGRFRYCPSTSRRPLPSARTCGTRQPRLPPPRSSVPPRSPAWCGYIRSVAQLTITVITPALHAARCRQRARVGHAAATAPPRSSVLLHSPAWCGGISPVAEAPNRYDPALHAARCRQQHVWSSPVATAPPRSSVPPHPPAWCGSYSAVAQLAVIVVAPALHTAAAVTAHVWEYPAATAATRSSGPPHPPA